jgi:hypothetical protein
LPANAVCQRHLRHLTQRVRQQAGSYRSSLARHFAVRRLLLSRLKPVLHTAVAVCLGGLKMVLRPHEGCLGVRLKTVGARLSANAVCQRHLGHLIQRVRQQAGAYRSSLARHFAVRRLTLSRPKPVPHTAVAVCLGGLKLVLRPHAVCLVVRVQTVGARLPANAVCQRHFRHLIPRVRQPAGSDRCPPVTNVAVRRLTLSRLKPLFKHPSSLPSASLSPRGEWRWPGARLPWLRRNPFRCRHSLAAPESVHGLPAL